MTMVRNTAWKDHFTINETDVQHAPNSARLHYWYGNELMKEKALKQFQYTLKVDNRYPLP